MTDHHRVMVVRSFESVYLRSSTISRTALRTRARVWTSAPWFSPSGESLPSFEGLFWVILVTSYRERKSFTQDEVLRSDFVPGEWLYSLLLYNIHLNNV